MIKNTDITIHTLKELDIFSKEIALNLTPGSNLLLEGDLGAGKTTFVSYLVKNIGSSDWINSPSYTLVQKYTATLKGHEVSVYHIDLYRLNSGQDLTTIDIDRYLNDKDTLVIIEWADKLADFYPKKYIKMDFHIIEDTKRRIVVTTKE